MSKAQIKQLAQDIRSRLGRRCLVMVGLMGAGKTTIGRQVAKQLALPFVDADAEIEKAADMSVDEIFKTYGEQHFRDGERKVIARLLQDGPKVLATGGGAFMDSETRDNIAKAGISIWLKADHKLLMKRVGRRNTRPLLKTDNPEQVMRDLIDQRYPVYGKADFVIQSRDVPHDVMVGELLKMLSRLEPA
jgi:shikimate kinase